MRTPIDLMELADIRLVDRVPDNTRAPRTKPTDLQPLPERRTVMIVDDDRPLLEMLVRVFQTENVDIIAAESGRDALQKASALEAPIDLLVTDYVMPGMHGRELAEEMRKINSELPVLYETGFSDLLFEGRRELEERSAFLEKPFTPRGIREAARLMLLASINPATNP